MEDASTSGRSAPTRADAASALQAVAVARSAIVALQAGTSELSDEERHDLLSVALRQLDHVAATVGNMTVGHGEG